MVLKTGPILLLVLGLLCAIISPAQAQSLTLLSQNANRFFDNIDDQQREPILSDAEFKIRVTRLAQRIGNSFDLPEIVALQEIENQHVLDRLVTRIDQQFGLRYQAVLIPGQDRSGINLGFLVHPDWRIDDSRQLLRDNILASNQTPVYTRPPLLVRLCRQDKCLTVINTHLRSMRGLNSATRGPWVADKRLQQANLLASWIDDFQRRRPMEPLLLVGDFNALATADRHVDTRGILLGLGDNPRTRLVERDLIRRDLVDLTETVPANRRYSYLFKGNKQQLDYLFASQSTGLRVEQVRFSRIDYRLSDHAAVFARLSWQ